MSIRQRTVQPVSAFALEGQEPPGKPQGSCRQTVLLTGALSCRITPGTLFLKRMTEKGLRAGRAVFRSGDEKEASAFFEDIHRHRYDTRPLVRHEVGIGQDMNHILQIPLYNIREPLAPAPEDQDMEPLDDETDDGNDDVDPHDDADQDPVQDTDEQFQPACVVFKDKELAECRRFFRYDNHRLSGCTIPR